MSLTASEERKVIAQLFNDEKMQIALDKILSGKRLEDKAYEQMVSKAFVERAKIGFGGATLFTLSDSDMQMRAAALMGVNDLGKSIIDDPEFIELNLPEFLVLAKDGSDNSPLMNADLCRAMVRYANDPEDMRMPEPARKSFDFVLTKDFKKSLTKKMMDGSFSSPLSEVDSEKLYEDLGLKSVYVDPESLTKKNNELSQEAPPDPSNEEDSTKKANALLSTDAMLHQIGIMDEKADLEARRHRLQIDAQTEAQMAINKLMDENPDWVRRTSINKLKDKISNGTNSLLGQDPHVYPSESLFGDSLAVMDAHGRVAQTLLHYRTGPGLNKRVEFKSPSVPESAYELAALQVRKQGIANPHIGANFRDPKTSLEFMKRSVEALLTAGYKIDDISVDRHLHNAFENFKMEKIGAEYTIGERPESEMEQEPEPAPTREVMPEEIIEAKNEAINTPALNVADMLANIEKGVGFDDIPNEHLEPLMPLLVDLANPDKTWQQIQDESGLTPASREVIQKFKHHIDSAVSKLDPENEKFSSKGPVAKDVKLIASSLNLLEPIYGKDTLNRIMPSLQKKADEIVKREAEKAERLARTEVNQQGNAPDNLQGQNNDNVDSNANNTLPQEQKVKSPPPKNPSDGFDPDLNGNNVPSHMNEGPPIDDSGFEGYDGVEPVSEGYDGVEYGDQDVYITPDLEMKKMNVDDMTAPAQNVDDMTAPAQNVDDMTAPAQNVDDMTAPLPEYYTGDEVSMSKEELEEVTASMNQAIEEYESGALDNGITENIAADSERDIERRVPDSWVKKLEEIGWEDLTPEQVRKIPKPSDFSEDQKKTVAYNISSTVNALLNMDEFFIDTATPKEKAFIDRMPPDMLPPKLNVSENSPPEVEPKEEPEEEIKSDFTRRRR